MPDSNICKCGHQRKMHEHHNWRTSCSQMLSNNVYCSCRFFKRRFLWFWV